ncbi:MAG: cache domain-containing protein, partial [Lachnospiraceae bacterium]|nr:cache domain-containing protein [Lachnospiraceae bacterium]
MAKEEAKGTGKRTQKLVNRLITIAVISAVVVGILIGVVGVVEIDNAYNRMTEEELRAAANMIADMYNFSYPGEWAEVDGALYKGEVNVSDDIEMLDNIKAKTDIDFTLFLGPIREVTTLIGEDGNRMVGTSAPDAVVATVLEGGQDYFLQDLQVAGQAYDVYYIPAKNDNGTIVGMFFAGRPSADIAAAKMQANVLMIVFALVAVAVIVVIGVMIARKTSPVMAGITNELTNLAGGSLALNLDPAYLKRKDELGDIAESVINLNEKLGGVIRSSKDMSTQLHTSGTELSDSATQASEAAKQVTDAVDDVSKGAISQAESVTDAASDSDTVGVGVDHINENVEELNAYTQAMEDACRATMDTLEALIRQSNEVQNSVTEIGRTIDSTNQSAKNISEFSQAIKDIAEQTNLLSLNASIEAARAGESGRGFAVVATEIGQLAVQSSESAEKIGAIVDQLLQDAAASVDVMKKLNENFGQQAEHL